MEARAQGKFALTTSDKLELLQKNYCARDACPGNTIMRARKILGDDNDAYLQNAVMLLWAGEEASKTDLAHGLFPSTLEGARELQMRANDGIEERVLTRLEERALKDERSYRTFLEQTLPTQLAYLIKIPEVQVYLMARANPNLRGDSWNSSASATTTDEEMDAFLDYFGSLSVQEPGASTGGQPDPPAQTGQARAASQAEWQSKISELVQKPESEIREQLRQWVQTRESALPLLLYLLAPLASDAADRLMNDLTAIHPLNRYGEYSHKICQLVGTIVADKALGVDYEAVPAQNEVYRKQMPTPALLGLPSTYAQLWACLGSPQPFVVNPPSESALNSASEIALGLVAEVMRPRNLEAPVTSAPHDTDVIDGQGSTLRGVRSVVLNIAYGGCAKQPPHIVLRMPDSTVVPQGEQDDYTGIELPPRLGSKYMESRETLRYPPEQMAALAKQFKERTTGSLVSEEYWQKANSKKYLNALFAGRSLNIERALWAPTVSLDAMDRTDFLRFGNISMNHISRAVASCTWYARLLQHLRNAGDGDSLNQGTSWHWSMAVVKLEMLPQLQAVYDVVRQGYDVQSVMSGGAKSAALASSNMSKDLLDVSAQDWLASRPNNEFDPQVVQGMPLLCGLVRKNLLPELCARGLGGDTQLEQTGPPNIESNAFQIYRITPDDAKRAEIEADLKDAAERFGFPGRDYYTADGNGDVLEAYGDAIWSPMRPSEVPEPIPSYASTTGLAALIQGAREATLGLQRLATAKATYREALRALRSGSKGGAGSAGSSSFTSRPASDAEERERRTAIWEDALRELAVSGDPLLAFLKQMAGTLHEEVQSIIKLEDRSMDAAQKNYREQRATVMRESIQFGQRVVDGVLTSVLRESRLKLAIDNNDDGVGSSSVASTAAETLVVVTDDSTKRVQELASGSSGLGFVEANAQIQRFLEAKKGSPMPLVDLVAQMRRILDENRQALLTELSAGAVSGARASLEYLAEPRNSLVVRIRNETFAAIRTAYELLCVELQKDGFRGRAPTAYECIEGPNRPLTTQFAQLAAYQLSHSRVFSSSSAVYVGVTPARMNLQMLRIALAKTVARVRDARYGKRF